MDREVLRSIMRIIRLHEGRVVQPKKDVSRFVWEPGDVVVLKKGKNKDTDNDGDVEEDSDDDGE